MSGRACRLSTHPGKPGRVAVLWTQLSVPCAHPHPRSGCTLVKAMADKGRALPSFPTQGFLHPGSALPGFVWHEPTLGCKHPGCALGSVQAPWASTAWLLLSCSHSPALAVSSACPTLLPVPPCAPHSSPCTQPCHPAPCTPALSPPGEPGEPTPPEHPLLAWGRAGSWGPLGSRGAHQGALCPFPRTEPQGYPRELHVCECLIERAPPGTLPQGGLGQRLSPQPSVGGPSQALVMLGPAQLSACFVLTNPRSWGRAGEQGQGQAGLSWVRGRECAGQGGCRRGKTALVQTLLT